MGYDSLEKRDGSLHLLFGKESQDTNHCQSSIVEFLDETIRLLFLTLVFGKAKRIKEVEWDRMGNPILVGKFGKGTRLASTHVVFFSSGL